MTGSSDRLKSVKFAVVICDMWDAHHCASAERRVREMAPHVNDFVSQVRAGGAFIIHAPAGCVDYYVGTAARLNAISAPHVDMPCSVDWNEIDPDIEGMLPDSLLNPGRCSCPSDQPRCADPPPYPWRRQTDLIDIADEDAVTDSGEELYKLLRHRGIEDVVLLGVHTNLCILGRPYGIRQLVYFGLRPYLCSDLTDSFHSDPRGHDWGTQETVRHIEQFWCPTIQSNELVEGMHPFRFREDR